MSECAGATRSIVLIGLPGAGKSTIGRNLSKLLKRDFLDTDHLIEQRLGSSIQRFFEREGEECFRDLEADVLADALHRSADSVIATGGGVVKRANNRTLMATRGVVIYLHATPRDLAVRLRHDVRRPLLQGGNRLQKFERLFEERHGLYGEIADFTVDSIGRPLHLLLREISALLERDASTRQPVAGHESPIAEADVGKP